MTGKLARYYASTTYFDAQAGRVIEALKKAGQFDNTIFIIAGDNGLSLGEHGLLGKQNLYEFGGMHVPLVFVGPGIPKGRNRGLRLSDGHVPDDLRTGRHSGAQGTGRPEPGAGHHRQGEPRSATTMFTAYRDVQRSIRDDRWKLIRYPQIDKTQLFDLPGRPARDGRYKRQAGLRPRSRNSWRKWRSRRGSSATPVRWWCPIPSRWSRPAPPAAILAAQGEAGQKKKAASKT